MEDFNPNNVATPGNEFFALPFSPQNAQTILISIPWDVTVSYGSGSAEAPEQLLIASAQVDLYDSFSKNAWEKGIATIPINNEIKQRSIAARKIAKEVIDYLEAGGDPSDVKEKTNEVNRASLWLDNHVFEAAKQWINQDKIIGLVGGDHSTPFGLIKAISQKYSNFGILHIDAHRDLRKEYEGFKSSHASIMYNCLQSIPQISKLVQVAVRDFCNEEQDLADNNPRIVSFDNHSLNSNAFGGISWDTQCKAIVQQLPQHVYVSFDIDGLDIAFCPHTGTPVPGGLTYNQAIYLLEEIIRSGREIISFDMVEVVPAPDSVVDLAVGVRIIQKLATLALMSKNKTLPLHSQS